MDKKEALSKSMALCSRSEKTIADIKNKLNDWSINEQDAKTIIEKLVAENFINERRYAVAFTRDKFRFNQWGKTKIAYMLKAKNIPLPIINEALEEIDMVEYQTLIQRLISDKKRRTSSQNVFDLKAKLMRYALSKGFEYEVINEVLKRTE
jgi:regulatory protein